MDEVIAADGQRLCLRALATILLSYCGTHCLWGRVRLYHYDNNLLSYKINNFKS